MSSEVWTYFIIDSESDGHYGKCNLCHKLISRGPSKTTSNLKKHLQKIHNINLKAEDQIKGQAKLNLSKVAKLDNSVAKLFSVSECSKPSTSFQTLHLEPLTVDTDMDDPGLTDPDKSVSPQHLSQFSMPSSTQKFSVASLSSPSSCSSFDGGSHSFSSSPDFPISPVSSKSIPCDLTLHYPKSISKIKKKDQPTLIQVYDKLTKFRNSDPRAIKISKLMAEMICLDLQPFSLVENKGFRNLIQHLEPRFSMPSRKTLANKIIPDMYCEQVKYLKEDILSAQYVALTTDMWTSISGTDYMALTCHYFTKKPTAPFFEINHKCLEVVPFPEISHTASNLKTFLIEKIEEWKLTEKVVAIVRDNGPDIKAALKISNFDDIPCTAHTLQLVIKDGFLTNTKISNLVSKCKKLVGSFKHSTKNTKILRRCQKQLKLPEHRLVQDEPTRWNSTLHMLKRLLEQKLALTMATSSGDTNCTTELTMDDWKTIEVAIEILDIFDSATLQLSKESSSISEIIPMVKVIVHQMSVNAPKGSGLQGLKNDLLTSMKIRFVEIENNKLLGPATLLDPRFKDKPFSNMFQVTQAKGILLAEMTNLLGSVIEDYDHDTVPSSYLDEGKGLWSTYRSLFKEVSSKPSDSSEVEELNKYLSEAPINPESSFTDVALYWERSQFLRLKKLVHKFLCVPPATVCSERLFSTAGNVVDSKRNRLDPERVKMLVFLHKNLKKD